MGSRKFGPNQLYAVEEIVNSVADVLVNVGFQTGVAADEQHYDGHGLADMSGVVDRLLEARTELEAAIGLARAYEIHRTAQQVTA
jgi:hypothetical protein